MIAFILSPVGRYVMGGLFVICLLLGVYYYIDRSAVLRERAAIETKSLKEVQDVTTKAINAGRDADIRNERGGLRDDDGFCRDCK